MGQVSISGWGVLDPNSAKLLRSLKRRQRALPKSALRGHSENLILPVPRQQDFCANSSSSSEQKAMMLPLQTTCWALILSAENDSFLGLRIIKYPELEGTHQDHQNPAPGFECLDFLLTLPPMPLFLKNDSKYILGWNVGVYVSFRISDFLKIRESQIISLSSSALKNFDYDFFFNFPP